MDGRIVNRRPGNGSIKRAGRSPLSDSRRILCTFDADTFEQIRQLADRDRVSFSEQIRRLVEFGLESAE